MDVKRSAARGIAVLAVALGAGHLVQTMASKPAVPKDQQASTAPMEKPKNVVPLAAGPEAVRTDPVVTPPKPEVAALAPAEPAPEAPATPAPLPPVAEAPALPQEPAAEKTATSCDITLDLMPEASAMIGVTLLAPCHPDERVTLRHAGLVVTGQTTAGGALFSGLPALDSAGKVQVTFADGAEVEATVVVPDLAGYRRFGVQWQGDDAFQIHGFEGGANYGQPGDINAVNPGRPMADAARKGGFLTLLGDPASANPLLAEIYTFPADRAARVQVVVEAAVTEKTCGRELLGETLESNGGVVRSSDLTLSMPECDAIGDYLVLKNLASDMNIATAD